jgi:hypothetical protein
LRCVSSDNALPASLGPAGRQLAVGFKVGTGHQLAPRRDRKALTADAAQSRPIFRRRRGMSRGPKKQLNDRKKRRETK